MKMTLSALRENYSLNSLEASKDLGIHQQTLLKYEKDSTGIPVDLARKLAEYYGVDLDDIFLGKKYELKQTFVNKKNLASQKGAKILNEISPSSDYLTKGDFENEKEVAVFNGLLNGYYEPDYDSKIFNKMINLFIGVKEEPVFKNTKH